MAALPPSHGRRVDLITGGLFLVSLWQAHPARFDANQAKDRSQPSRSSRVQETNLMEPGKARNLTHPLSLSARAMQNT
jgi:hypothetical protein